MTAGQENTMAKKMPTIRARNHHGGASSGVVAAAQTSSREKASINPTIRTVTTTGAT